MKGEEALAVLAPHSSPLTSHASLPEPHDTSARPLRPFARPGTSTWAAPAPPCSTGSMPGTRAALSCSASRTPTASAAPTAHTRVILDGLTWLGITWDEGPFFQGEYAAPPSGRCGAAAGRGQGVSLLLHPGGARRAAGEGRGGRGRPSGTTAAATGLAPAEVEPRESSAGIPSTIRFLLQDDEIAWDDAVHGRISFQGRDLDDFVILRSDDSADLQSGGRLRRHRHADHPRHPGRRPHLQHARSRSRSTGRWATSRRSSPTCR